MDWSTIISVVAIVVFLLLMMRGCGGMMAGGGCGMISKHLKRARFCSRSRGRAGDECASYSTTAGVPGIVPTLDNRLIKFMVIAEPSEWRPIHRPVTAPSSITLIANPS